MSAAAETFKDEMHVYINGMEVSSMESTIILQNEGETSSLSLKNFALRTGEDVMYVGNITIDGISPVRDDAGIHYKKTSKVMITAGDVPADAQWIGPMLSSTLKGIPVSLDALLADKLTAEITIDLTETMGQHIIVTFGKSNTTRIDIPESEGARCSDAIYNLSGQRIAAPRRRCWRALSPPRAFPRHSPDWCGWW